uniref:Atpob1 n=1 Tax=Solanum tuberosum TaxID=4113 RepID=M1E0R5_SOLTU
MEEQRHLIVQIHESVETALMDLLKFIYCNTLSTKTPIGLVNVLMAADRFEVASCMTTETALCYLDLPSEVFNVDAVKPLADVANLLIIRCFRDINKKGLLTGLPFRWTRAFPIHTLQYAPTRCSPLLGVIPGYARGGL